MSQLSFVWLPQAFRRLSHYDQHLGPKPGPQKFSTGTDEAGRKDWPCEQQLLRTAPVPKNFRVARTKLAWRTGHVNSSCQTTAPVPTKFSSRTGELAEGIQQLLNDGTCAPKNFEWHGRSFQEDMPLQCTHWVLWHLFSRCRTWSTTPGTLQNRSCVRSSSPLPLPVLVAGRRSPACRRTRRGTLRSFPGPS